MSLLVVRNYLSLQFLVDTWRQEVGWFDGSRVYAGSWSVRWFLHAQERLYAGHFAVVRAVGQRTSFGGQSAGGHPFGILVFLEGGEKKIRISCDVHSGINFGFTHRIASNPHFAVGATIIRRHLQFDIEFALCQINLWCDFAAAQIYDHGGRLVAAKLLT